MPHQCVKCSRIIPMGSRELLEGCASCKGHFFFYIRDEQLAKIKETPIEIPEEQKETIEKDIREMAGIVEDTAPVILDIESVRVTGDGKFELDIVNLFRKDRPLIYKLEEGKYIIDLASTLKRNIKDIREIVDPEEKKD
ncbi:Zn-ribbon domain-containing protein [Patescibacteria group bacterium]|nr:Zn-ribbon domain-containing protein [Patescibacteria group bacterium]